MQPQRHSSFRQMQGFLNDLEAAIEDSARCQLPTLWLTSASNSSYDRVYCAMQPIGTGQCRYSLGCSTTSGRDCVSEAQANQEGNFTSSLPLLE